MPLITMTLKAMIPMTSKGQAIADYAISKLGCAYIYGGYGERLCTPAFRRERAGAYPDQKNNTYKNCLVLSGKQTTCNGCKWHNKQAYDCAQLTKYACKAGGQALVSGANSQWTKTAWENKGKIDTLPDVPGVILYHSNANGRMTHTGVYVGNGYAVEAKEAKAGVVKTLVKNRSWTHWAVLPGVLSGEMVNSTTPPKEPQETPSEAQKPATTAEVIDMTTLRNGSKGTQVKVLQWLLNLNGFDAGKVDGIFGSNTLKALKAFQKAKGLEADGVAGKKTWTKILA